MEATGQVISPCIGLKASFASLLGAIGLLLISVGTGVAGPNEGMHGDYRPALRHHYRRVPAVRGYLVARRVGGYSYSPEDVINTYGLTRSLFGATNSYRDLSTDRQTPSGPFDHGFFFDSGIAPHGGESPYLH